MSSATIVQKIHGFAWEEEFQRIFRGVSDISFENVDDADADDAYDGLSYKLWWTKIQYDRLFGSHTSIREIPQHPPPPPPPPPHTHTHTNV